MRDPIISADDHIHPRADSTWPGSRRAIEESFRGGPEATRRRLLCDNARELYRL